MKHRHPRIVCRAKRSDGVTPCRRWAMNGKWVCATHGGRGGRPPVHGLYSRDTRAAVDVGLLIRRNFDDHEAVQALWEAASSKELGSPEAACPVYLMIIAWSVREGEDPRTTMWHLLRLMKLANEARQTPSPQEMLAAIGQRLLEQSLELSECSEPPGGGLSGADAKPI